MVWLSVRGLSLRMRSERHTSSICAKFSKSLLGKKICRAQCFFFFPIWTTFEHPAKQFHYLYQPCIRSLKYCQLYSLLLNLALNWILIGCVENMPCYGGGGRMLPMKTICCQFHNASELNVTHIIVKDSSISKWCAVLLNGSNWWRIFIYTRARDGGGGVH